MMRDKLSRREDRALVKALRIAASVVKSRLGYRVALPIAAYKTWQDKMLEGVGVCPNVEVAFTRRLTFTKMIGTDRVCCHPLTQAHTAGICPVLLFDVSKIVRKDSDKAGNRSLQYFQQLG